MQTESETLKLRTHPARYVEKNGERIPLWNPDVFYRSGRSYYTIRNGKKQRYIFIDSYRDRDLRMTIYRLLGQDGETIHVNCMDAISHINP